MEKSALIPAPAVGAKLNSAGGADLNRGINFPRIYDLLLLILTRGRERAYRKDVLDLSGAVPGRRLLDIGCGTGTQAIASWRRCQPEGSVVGIDISEKMLAAARRKAHRAGLNMAFHQADAAELPFENEQFDIVTITTVMHMIPEDRRRLCLADVSRVLKRGGRVLLIDYAGDPDRRRHISAKHGPHRLFDLHSLYEPLSVEGFEGIEGGPLDWLSLHFVRGTKR